MKVMFMKSSFSILIFLLLFLSNFSFANDVCGVGTGYSQNPLVSGVLFSKEDSVSGNSASSSFYDNYYFKAPSEGSVTIILTGTNVSFSTGLTNCPSASNGKTSTTLTLSASDLDFNIKVYRSGGNASSNYNYTLTVVHSTVKIGEREFAIRNPVITRNIKGDLKVIGNTVLCVKNSNGVCYDYTGTGSNSELNLQYIDVDGVTRTYNNSSQAQLAIPATATIKWAGLYSQGYLNTYNSTTVATTLQDPIYVTVPNVGTIASIPEVIDLYANSNDGYTYDTFAPLPSLIGKKGSAVNGWITGANIKADTGTEGSGLGNFGAWTLVVVYEDSTSTLKNISVFDGYKRVANANGFNTVNITPSGFLTPTSGDVKSTLSLFVGEGDKNILGDKLYVNGTAINATNAFYSTMNGFTANPSYSNTQGIDIQNHDIGIDGDTSHLQIIGNSATSAKITLTSTQDTYFPSLVAFTTELYEPRVCYFEAYYNADGNATLTNANVGDIITIKSWIANMKKDSSDGNLETAEKVEITMEHDDTNFEYQAGSTKIQNIGESTYTTKTDKKDGDIATFYSDTNTSVWHIGTGATGTDGGDLTPNVTNDATNKAYVSFKTKLQTSGDITVANIYKVSYENSNMGIRVGDESPINIGVCKDFNASIIVSAPLGAFNVVNQNFSSNTDSKDGKHSDNALFTQIAGKGFQVKILALDSDYTTLKSYTGDVNLTLISQPSYTGNDTADQAICSATSSTTSPQPISFLNESSKNLTLNYPTALKDVAFKIAYNDNGKTKYVCSRDSFSIRPLGYKMDTNETHLIGGKLYELTIQSVLNDKTTKAVTYDQAIPIDTVYKSATIDLNIPTDCNKSTLNDIHSSLTPLTLTHGEVINKKFTYPNIGDINVTIIDNDWTLSDQNRFNKKGYNDCIEDSNTSIPVNGKIGCLIKSVQPFTFSPKKFTNTLVLKNFNAEEYTYIANDSNMSAMLFFTPTAILENNQTATNYTKKCYAKDINYTVSFINNNPSLGWGNGIPTAKNRIYFKADIDGATSKLENNATVGKAIFSSKEGNFTSGTASNLTVLFNFNRDINRSDEPFKIARNDFNITQVIDQNNTLGSDFNRTLDQNATFYYGRVYSTDYRGPKEGIPTTIRYEIYCKSCNKVDMNISGTQSPMSLNWYQNPLHLDRDGNVTTFSSVGTTLINNTNEVSSGVIANGKESNNLSNAKAPYTDIIKMTPSSWLIFNPYNANATTNDFSVEFTRSGNWSGAGSVNRPNNPRVDEADNNKTGKFTNTNDLNRSNKKMNW